MSPPLYVFDAYGTLFDVNAAVMRHAEALGERAARLAELWRSKQLEYSWVYALAGRRIDFWTLTIRSLDDAAARCGPLAPELRQRLLDAYAELDAYPDAGPTLAALRHRGCRTAILSNGTPAMLAKAVAAAALTDLLDAVISVESAGVFKTDPRAYALVGEAFDVAPGDVRFVSSNRWDVAGATAFGFRTLWVDRGSGPDEYPDLAPDVRLSSLTRLASSDPELP